MGKQKARGARAQRLTLCGALACCSPLLAAGTIDWSSVNTHFAKGEANSPMVYNRKDSSRCVGRWRLHADAVDDGAFPIQAHQAWNWHLGLHGSIGGAEFFTTDEMIPSLVQAAADEAEIMLRKALAGDAEAFRLYFEALGHCSTKAEEVREDNEGAPEEVTVG